MCSLFGQNDNKIVWMTQWHMKTSNLPVELQLLSHSVQYNVRAHNHQYGSQSGIIVIV